MVRNFVVALLVPFLMGAKCVSKLPDRASGCGGGDAPGPHPALALLEQEDAAVCACDSMVCANQAMETYKAKVDAALQSDGALADDEASAAKVLVQHMASCVGKLPLH